MPKQNSPLLLPPGGPVKYPDDSGLKRPIDMPSNVRRSMLIVLAVACLIGGFVIFKYLDAVITGPQKDKEMAAEYAAREVALDLPLLEPMLNQDDSSIMSDLSANGYTLYEKTPAGSSEKGGFEVIKLPSDVSLEEAGLIYLSGINNASASDAAKILNGSWTLSADRSSGVSIRVRYADFSSGNIDAAIQAAKEAEGLSDAQATDAGVDDSGNTYQEGVVQIGEGEDAETYSWRVSVVPLSEVYSVAGLPENALFVGIRFTK